MNLNSTKIAIQDALAWEWKTKGDSGIVEYSKYLCRIQKSGTFDNNQKICDSTEVGYILAAISKQKDPISQWLHYTYGIEERSLHRLKVSFHLFSKFFMGKIKQRYIDRYKKFSEIIVDDFRVRTLTHGAEKMPLVVYGREMGIDPDNWLRDWKYQWGQGLDELIKINADGIGNVSRIVKALRDPESEYSPSQILSEY